MGATGPHDIALLGRGNAQVSIGLGLERDPALRATCPGLGPMFGWLAQVPASGNWRLDADLAAYESSANPDGSNPPESNPYGVLMQPGATIAADAGGNDLLRVAANGSIETLAVFPLAVEQHPRNRLRPDLGHSRPGRRVLRRRVGELRARAGESVACGSRRGADDLQERVHDGHRHHVRCRRQSLRARVRTRRSLAGPGGRRQCWSRLVWSLWAQ
jgi:hypothetical protein